MRLSHLTLSFSSITFVAAGLAATASAQTDHLHCYKVKEATKFKEAFVALDPLSNPPFTLGQGCKLKGKVKKFCSPTNKTVISVSTDATQLGISGPALDTEYLCYKIKCDLPGVDNLALSDQFGNHTLSKIKSKELCVPVGVTSTTTTTTLPPTACTVTFTLSDATDLAGLQFDVQYDNTLGDFDGSGLSVACSSSVGGTLNVFNDLDISELLGFAAAGDSDLLVGPVDVLTCSYSSYSGPATAGDFTIVEVDSIAVAGMPAGGGNLCGAPITGTFPPSARDAVRIIRAAVGAPGATCDLCECDTNNSGGVTAVDAVLSLRNAVQDPSSPMNCPACVGGPVIDPPTESVTVTAGVSCP